MVDINQDGVEVIEILQGEEMTDIDNVVNMIDIDQNVEMMDADMETSIFSIAKDVVILDLDLFEVKEEISQLSISSDG